MPDYDVREIEARLVEATRSWVDDLLDALVEQLGEERGTELFAQYRDAFPPGYRDDFTPPAAVLDIQRMERLDPEGDLEMTLYRPLEAADDFFVLKLLRSGQPILLSDVLPLLEDLGVKVYDERPYEIDRAGPVDAWIYDFGLTSEDGPIDLDAVGEAFKDAFAQAWRGEIEVDGFNRLVLRAGLTWREVAMLRALAKYLRQAGAHVQPGLHGGDARRPRGDRPEARRALPHPLRPGAGRGARRRSGGPRHARSRRRSTRSRASTRTASSAASSASSRRR